MVVLQGLDECFNCHQLGHWAKECPNNSTQEQVPYVSFGSRRSDECFNCHQLGHWAKFCPNNFTQEQAPHVSLGNDVIPPKMCRCRKECRILISNTSTNPGRKFYRCKQCDFFKWCNEPEASASQNPNPNTQLQQQSASLGCNGNFSGRIEWSYELSIPCECEAGPCRVLTARNKGRQYFTCPIKKGEGSCGFFKWRGELISAASSSSSLTNNHVRSQPE